VQARIALESTGGISLWSIPTETTSPLTTCAVTGCGDYAECLVGNDFCSCISSVYHQEVVPISSSRRCEILYTPCTEYNCLGGSDGSFGTCIAETGICQCNAGTVLAEMAAKDEDNIEALMAEAYAVNGEVTTGWKTCVPSVASKAEQREFWTLSLWLSAWGLLASLLLSWEFVLNTQLKYPNTMMQAFISFAAPDFILATANFVVFIVQLVNGNSLGSETGRGGYSDD